METIQSDSTVTMSQVYQDFKGAIQGAADALKVGAEHVYEVMVRQQVILSFTWIFVWLLFISLSIAAWKISLKYVPKLQAKDRNGDYGAIYAAPSVITLIGLIIVAASFNTVLTGFLNPEYGAMMEIKSFIR